MHHYQEACCAQQLRGGEQIAEWDVVEDEYDYLAATTDKREGDPDDESDDSKEEMESAAWIYEDALKRNPTNPDSLVALGREHCATYCSY